MRFYATQTFEGLTLQKTSLLPDKKFFLGGSCAAQTVITGEKLVRVQYGLHSPGLSTLDIYGKITHVKPIRPSSVEFVKELPQLPDRPKRRIKLHAKPERVDLCRYILPKKNIVIKCDHTPFKEEIQKPAVSMSSRTKQKIRNKLQALFYYCQSENIPTYFLTLTFIAAVSDEKAIRIFNTYLTSLRKYQPGINYLWVAEKQQNGNLHFHVIIDRFLPVRQFNTLWVKVQLNAGISYRNFHSWAELLQGIRDEKTKMLNPLDVKEIKNLEGVNQYVTKYVSKNDTQLSCRVWHCSRAVSALGVSTFVPNNQVQAHGDEKLNLYVDRHGAIHNVNEMAVIKTETGEFGKYKFRHVNNWSYYIKTLNKKELHKDIVPYINHCNREIMQAFKELALIRYERHFVKQLATRKRLTPCTLNLYPLHQYWEQLTARIGEIKNKIHWIIPILNRQEILEDEKFNWC